MHRLPLLAFLTLPLAAFAEQPAAEQPQAAAVESAADVAQSLADLERRLAESEQQRNTLAAQLASPDNSQDEAVISHLRQENQRLKLQLREARAEQPPRLLSEQQTWYVAGGGTALLAFILGALGRGSRRRQRREWIN